MMAKRAMIRACLIGSLLLGGCAGRPETGALLASEASAPGAKDHSLLIATTRERDDRPGTYFNGERGSLSFASLTVSVPPTHAVGNVEWPSTEPGDPGRDFVTRQGRHLDGDKQFLAAVNQRLKSVPKGKRKVMLFVHGYNTLFAEGVYRFTQVVHDSHSPAVPVLFTWASRGSTFDYVYDNNSATIARDGLERTLRLLAASDADEINVLAHSMGNWATVEAFRQLRISGKTPLANKVGTVVRAAPDIDVDVFKSQMERIGKPKKPFLIVLSRDDKALGLSRFLAGSKDRLGASGNTADLTALGAVVIDLSDVAANDSTNHGKFAQIAEIAPSLEGVLAQGMSKKDTDSPTGVADQLIKLPVSLITLPIKILRAD